MAEGNDTPGNEPPEGGDLDFLAARRARRAELSDPTLVRRAEAAEATVRTLETHLGSLQKRLRELEQEQQRAAEQLHDREQEVRRVKQREYAEQQLRVEVQESHERLQREYRAEVDRLNRRLAVGERHARELADQLERARRELAEAEQTAAANDAGVRRAQEQLVVREADLSQRELALDRTRAEVQQRLSDAQELERQVQELGREAQELRAAAELDRQGLEQRLGGIEQQAGELQRGIESERAARERSEQDLARMQQSYGRLQAIVTGLRSTAVELRDAIERDRHQRPAIPAAPVVAAVEASPPSSTLPDEEALRRAEMAEALAAAVERLRARVEAVSELQVQSEPEVEAEIVVAAEIEPPEEIEPIVEVVPETEDEAPPRVEVAAEAAPGLAAEVGSEPAEGVGPEPAADVAREPAADVAPEPVTAGSPQSFSPRQLEPPAQRVSWLAPAIRQVAQRRDPKLAAELIVELLAAQCLVVDGSMTYRLKITELGVFQVRLWDGRATVERLEADGSSVVWSQDKVDFVLEGPAIAFSELAAGGTGRKLSGLKVSGRKRRARRLRLARRAPLALPDLVGASMKIWPGLLLLALAEAIDPLWTKGSSYVIAFAIDAPPSATIYVRVRDGEPIVVTRVRGEQPRTIVSLSERSFLTMMAGVPLPDSEQVLLEGETRDLEQLLDWAERAQGLGAAG